MSLEEYVSDLGYDVGKQLFSVEDEDGNEVYPEYVHVMARWEKAEPTCHFNVKNTVYGLFWAFDECGDPASVRDCWCCEPQMLHCLDMDSEPDFNFIEAAKAE